MWLFTKIRHLLVSSVMLMFGLSVLMLVILYNAVRYTPLCLFKRNKKYKERPACMDDIRLGVHGEIKTGFGIIHYVASGTSGKPLMLLVHGFPESWYSWKNQITEFQKDYRVIAIDSRGAGESQKDPATNIFTLDKLALDIKDVIEQLGYSSCVLVGHDWGGVLTFYFAETYPEMVDKIVVINAPHISDFRELMFNNFVQTINSWYVFAFQWPLLPEFTLSLNHFAFFDYMIGKHPHVTEEELEAVKYPLCQPGTLTSTVNYYRANVSMFNWSLKRNPILCPTLIIFGTGDKFLDVSFTKGHEKYVRDLTVVLIEGGDHYILQHKPNEVNKRMRDFLARGVSKKL